MERGFRFDFVDPHPLASFWEKRARLPAGGSTRGFGYMEEWLGKIGKRAPAV